jgi:DnaK suppressor protein
MTRTTPSTLSPSELEALRAQLLALRAELLARPHVSATRDPEGPEVGDAMDEVARVSEHEESGARNERDKGRLIQIDHALAKMERGEYGVSEDSGEPIGFGRLRAVPWARLTVEEEEELERNR